MPITLITGLPGHGKTLYALARYKGEAEKDNRPVFHNGIPGLNIPNWQPWDVMKWDQLPATALFIIDEAQITFPVRGRGSPDAWIEKLTTHRHLGIDIVLITQNPMLLDSFVRRLVDRHFHIVRKFGTSFATIHEFANGSKDNVHQSRKDSITHEWKYPKEVFDWYKSAEVHTVKRRIPARVFVLLAMPFIFLALAYVAYLRLNPEAQGDRVTEHGGGKPASEAQGGLFQPPGGARRASQENGPMTVEQWFVHNTGRVPSLPHTAPAYDDVTKPVHAPYPAACVQMPSKGCKCYTQQGTVLDVGDLVCLQIVERGFFVAWDIEPKRQDREPHAKPEPKKEQPPAPHLISLRGPHSVGAGGLGVQTPQGNDTPSSGLHF